VGGSFIFGRDSRNVTGLGNKRKEGKSKAVYEASTAVGSTLLVPWMDLRVVWLPPNCSRGTQRWLHCCGPVVRLNIMATGVCDQGRCSSHGSQEAETERRRVQGEDIPFKAKLTRYPLPPTRPYLLIPHSAFSCSSHLSMTPLVGDQAFNMSLFEGPFLSKPCQVGISLILQTSTHVRMAQWGLISPNGS
jgi:hypothetical protein